MSDLHGDGDEQAHSFVGQPINDPLVRMAGRYPAAAVALTSSIIVVLEVLLAARGQVSTALAIVNSASPTSVVIGIAVELAPLVATPAAVAAVLWYRVEAKARRRALVLFIVAVDLCAIAAVIAPWYLLALYVGLSLLSELIRRYRLRAFRKKGLTVTSERLEASYGFALMVLIGSSFITARPWLPAERVALTNGSVVVGYVLNDAGPWTSILTDSDRLVVQLDSSTLNSRTLCQASASSLGPTFAQLLRPPPTLPDC